MKALTREDPGREDLENRLAIHLGGEKNDGGIIPGVMCDGSFRLTTNILTSMFPEYDVAMTLDHLRKVEHTYCDCEILVWSKFDKEYPKKEGV